MRPTIRAAVPSALGVLAALLLLPSVSRAALADDLHTCQDVVRTASIRLNAQIQRRFGACVERGIACLVSGENAGCCDRAAAHCRRDLRRLEGEERRFVRRLENLRCAEVPFERLLDAATGGPIPGLGFANTLDACARLAPPVDVVDLPSLVECLRRLAREDTVHRVATVEMPLACDALTCMDLTSEFPTACNGEPATCLPGAAPSASPTATAGPGATATPTAEAPTATPVVSATPTSVAPTVTATAVATTTAVPTASETSTPAATVTPTPVPTGVATVTATSVATPVPTITATGAPTVVVTATPVATVTQTPVPTETATPTVEPTPVGPLCGNEVVEDGEDCDDGNTVGCDECPSDCSLTVRSCATDTLRHEQVIDIDAPQDTNLSGATFCLEYPDGIISLPGTGAVSGRVSGFSGLSSVNDFDRSVQVALLPNAPGNPLSVTLSFDRCLDGQEPVPAPLPADFDCVVRQASDEFSNLIDPPTLVVCAAGGGLE